MYEIGYWCFIIVYIILTLYILKEDLETKYIPLLGFYPFVIASGIFYHITYGYIWGTFLIEIYIILILTLDIIEAYTRPLASIGEKWKFLDTGIYDYFLYLFITLLLVSHIFVGFPALGFLIEIGIIFFITIFLGVGFLIFHQKKVQALIIQNHITDYETLDTALYERKLTSISIHDIFKKHTTPNPNMQELIGYYKNRVPLFLFGNIFILCFIGLHTVKNIF